MSFQTAGDIPIQITSETAGSERRISPSWTIGQLKSKLELITGIPPSSQKLALSSSGQPSIPIEAVDEDTTQLASFPLIPYAEIHVSLDASFSSDIAKVSSRRLILPIWNSRCWPFCLLNLARLCICQPPASYVA